MALSRSEAKDRADSVASASAPAPSRTNVPPCSTVWWIARSRPSSRDSSVAPSSGHLPPSADARPHCGHAHAGGARPRGKERRDASVGRGRRASASSPRPHARCRPCSLAPAVERRLVVARRAPRRAAGRTMPSSSVGPACASACVQPTIASARLVRELRRELAAHLLRRDDDHVRRAAAAHGAVDLLADRLQVLQHDVLDVTLVARLRPAALVVPAGHLFGLVRDLPRRPPRSR